MDFPAVTNIAAAGVIERVGIGGGTLLKSGSSITYDVTTPVSIPAGTFIKLEMFGLKYPINPSTAFTATITTRDSGGNLIDGPSQTNVYTMKQIGTSDIADNSITSTEPAGSFMKRVTVLDTAGGHAVGWNPDGGTTTFTISEPALNSDESFFTIEVRSDFSNINQLCDVANQVTSAPTFFVTCSTAPPNGSELHYVVGSLPLHVIG
jgi:hypothetical protein